MIPTHNSQRRGKKKNSHHWNIKANEDADKQRISTTSTLKGERRKREKYKNRKHLYKNYIYLLGNMLFAMLQQICSHICAFQLYSRLRKTFRMIFGCCVSLFATLRAHFFSSGFLVSYIVRHSFKKKFCWYLYTTFSHYSGGL